MKNIPKYICLAALCLLISIPLLKEYTPLLDSYCTGAELKGYFPPVQEVEVAAAHWWTGQLQSQVEPYLKRNMKMRPWTVRVNNQLRYDLLRDLRPDIIEGKDGYLFQNSYIEDLAGVRYVGDITINDQSDKLKYLAKALEEKYDTKIILAIAPSKAIVHQDKLPTQYDIPVAAETNYEAYKNALQGSAVHIIDYNEYFTVLNKATEHIVSTRGGVHWSQYAAILAADSLTHYMGQALGKSTPPLDLSNIVKSTTARDTDEDLAESLNFWRSIDSENYSYFVNHLPNPDSIVGHKPEVLLIGDSFCWNIWSSNVPRGIWGPTSKFLFYFSEVYPIVPENYPDATVNDDTILKYVAEAEFIVLLYNPMTMDKLGSTFIDTMHRLLTAEANPS